MPLSIERMPEEKFRSMSNYEQVKHVIENCNRSNWLRFPLMPLVKLESAAEEFDLGFLYAKDIWEKKFVVYLGIIFCLRSDGIYVLNQKTLEKLVTIQYPSIRELSLEWKVD